MKQLEPRHHYYIISLAALGAAMSIVTAGAPYLYADTQLPNPTPPDTALTAPLPQDPQPSLPPSQPLTQPAPLPCFSGTTSTGATTPCMPPQGNFGQTMPSQPSFPQNGQMPLKPAFPQSSMQGGSQGPWNGQIPQPGSNANGQQNMPQPLNMPSSQLNQNGLDQGQGPTNASNAGGPNPAQMISSLKFLAKQLKQRGCGTDTAKLQSIITGFSSASSTGDSSATTDQSGTTTDQSATTDPQDLMDQVNTIRHGCELRQALHMVDRQLTRLENFVKKSSSFSALGIDTSAITNKVTDMRTALRTAQQSLDQETDTSLEDVDTYLQDLQNEQPQDIQRIITGLQQLNKLTGIIKDASVKQQIADALSPMIDDFNSGNFSDAADILDQNFSEIVKIAQLQLRLQRGRPGSHKAVTDKLNALADKMQSQLGLSSDQGNGTTTSPTIQSAPTTNGGQDQSTTPQPVSPIQ